MKKINTLLITALVVCSLTFESHSQSKRKGGKTPSAEQKSFIQDANFEGIKFRSIGPAFMSGRIADIAIHPKKENTWYVAVGSGGVWKTVNAGTTWIPLFDKQSVYSTGCIAINPNNPHEIWVGTGENVGGRHLGYGDGIYKSTDDGKTWVNMGLKKSQHISEIIFHPVNSNIMWVAAQGPLWNKGGERGLYKTTDGGKTWKKTLGDEEWVGVTDIALDPRDPDRIYAATWQRHRNVAAYMGGGPGSGLHKSDDGGETWEALNNGLPKSNMGKIGFAISPQKPDILYAAIELDTRTGGVFKSTNRGASWKKMSDAVSGATGPHYYQELYASPHQFDKIYLVDVRMQISENGGKTFRRMNEEHKHSDNHAVAFKISDPDYLLVGTDGGLYETFDGEKNWRFINNLPITQYYKVAVDDATPFYNIYGGTQDNNTHGGPSRTLNRHGIRNADWFITLFGDGHQPATEPNNPNIVYSEWQQGNLVRIDRTTGEIVYIKPQPQEGEPYERFNWDAPILVSPHKPERLYFASQRVWKSENRGDSWTTISNDLTKDQDRLTLEIMGSTQSFDNPWDVYAMSNYNTITSLAESPKKEGLIYAGTDDGIIQVTEDNGDNWSKINVGSISGIPSTAFINDIKADLFDENIVYVALDNHKYGDFHPYLIKSSDKGLSWEKINSNLPKELLVWRIVQDHVKSELFFLATEFGIYFSIDSGGNWTKLTGGLPTISFRDLAIQKRENDLIGASFGRSFYVLDDYSFLRNVNKSSLEKEGVLFAPRDSWWYVQQFVLGFTEKASQGAGYYTAKNPDFGATFTYYLKDDLKTLREERQEKEKELTKNKQSVNFVGWDVLEKEEAQTKPKVWLLVKNQRGDVVRRLSGKTKKGFHRTSWDLTYPPTDAIKIEMPKISTNTTSPTGVMVSPGKYSVTLVKEENGNVVTLDTPQYFEVKKLNDGYLTGSSPQETADFWKELALFKKNQNALGVELEQTKKRLKAMQSALRHSNADIGTLDQSINELSLDLRKIEIQLYGHKVKNKVGERSNPTISDRFNVAATGTLYSTYGPTPTHTASFELAQKDFEKIVNSFNTISRTKIPSLEKKLQEAGAPWIQGQSLPINK